MMIYLAIAYIVLFPSFLALAFGVLSYDAYQMLRASEKRRQRQETPRL